MSLLTNPPSWQSAGACLKLTGWLLGPLYLLMVSALYGAFLYAPTEREMGEVQRIFYFHVGAAWTSFFAFFIVFLGGLIYLVTRRQWWDHLAATSAEIGVMFTTIALATGSIWAKPIWNTWWPWGDPRLMTTMVLWLIYVSYLILRSSLPEGDKKYKYCAVFGIIGFFDVPIVWLSIRWWRTIHPVVITPDGAQLESEMVHALIIAVLACTVLYVTLLTLKTAIGLNATTTEELGQKLMDSRLTRA